MGENGREASCCSQLGPAKEWLHPATVRQAEGRFEGRVRCPRGGELSGMRHPGSSREMSV